MLRRRSARADGHRPNNQRTPAICGIVGILAEHGCGDLARLRAMMEGMIHRGPDDEGHFESTGRNNSGARWILGHRRLAVIDLSPLGRQPMVDPATGNVIVFNGEIYNFQDLRRVLESEGIAFTSKTDTEVVLLGYARWGRQVLERIRGMFAFGILDAAKGSMLLARDRLGEKPLYYCCRPSARGVRFAFASEIRTLLTGRVTDHHLDQISLQTYLCNGFIVDPHTIVAGIRSLEAGSSLEIDCDGQGQPRRYWQIPLPEADSAKGNGSHQSSFGETLADAVRRQLVSDAPLGAFLSGGIDSSVVVGLAQRQRTDPLRTFTLVFEEGEFNEAEYARSAAEAFGTKHREVMLTRNDFQASLPCCLDALDQPSFDGANTFFISKAARELGLTVALAGTGGDEIFGGYASFSQLAKVRRIRRWLSMVPGSFRKRLKQGALWLDGRRRGGFPSQTSTGKAISLLTETATMVQVYQTMSRIYLEETVAELLESPQPLTEHGLDPGVSSYLKNRTERRMDLPALSLMELHSYLGQRLLRDTDCMSMAVSLEVRLPLIDYRVIEQVSLMEERARYFPVRSKRCLWEASGLQLPECIVKREKRGFELPIAHWLRDVLRRETADVLLDPVLCRQVGLRPKSILQLWEQFLHADPGLYWTRIWALYVLLRWCAKHGITNQHSHDRTARR